MVAVDTNVLVRLLTGDDPRQSAMARSLVESEPIWIAKTVLLETAWALHSTYGIQEEAIRDAFTRLLGLQNVQAEDAPAIADALALTAHGIEMADAIHLTSRPAGTRFVTFDKSFLQRAGRAGVSAISGVSG